MNTKDKQTEFYKACWEYLETQSLLKTENITGVLREELEKKFKEEGDKVNSVSEELNLSKTELVLVMAKIVLAFRTNEKINDVLNQLRQME